MRAACAEANFTGNRSRTIEFNDSERSTSESQREPETNSAFLPCVKVATAFHKFYTECRIKDAAPELRRARILLCNCTATVIENALSCFGVSAPDHM